MKVGDRFTVRWVGIQYELELGPSSSVLGPPCARLPGVPVSLSTSTYSPNIWFADLEVAPQVAPHFARALMSFRGDSPQGALDNLGKMLQEIQFWVDSLTTLSVPREQP